MANMKALSLAILLAAAPLTLGAQQNNTASALAGPVTASGAGAAHPSDDRPALQHRNPRYQVQRDDILNISFALSPELNQTVTIQPDGYINLLSAGSIYIQGMTVPEVVDALKTAYSKTLHDPIIDVDLKDFQKPYFVAMGQVGKPGQYDMRTDMTVTEAIGVAGGFAPTAKMQVILYHRGASGWVEAKELKLNDMVHAKNVNEDVEMRSGDMLFVPEKAITKIRKYIPYGVGTYVN